MRPNQSQSTGSFVLKKKNKLKKITQEGKNSATAKLMRWKNEWKKTMDCGITKTCNKRL